MSRASRQGEATDGRTRGRAPRPAGRPCWQQALAGAVRDAVVGRWRGRTTAGRSRIHRDFRANFTVTLCCEVNSGRKWEFQYQRGIANGTYFHSFTGRARVRARARRARGWSLVVRARADERGAEQRRARVEQLCVGVEQRWQGLRSVTPSPHAARGWLQHDRCSAACM